MTASGICFQPAEQTGSFELSAILRQSENYNTSQLASCQKQAWKEGNYKRQELQNDCLLFVWQNEDNFMQSVINCLSI